jgi:hypothetical protein
VRIYGFIRVYNDKKTVVGHGLQVVKEMNEVSNHFLQIFVNHNRRHKGELTKEDLGVSEKKPVKNDEKTEECEILIMRHMHQLLKSSRFAHKNDIW